MSLSKLTFLKTLTKPLHYIRPQPPTLRHLSTTTSTPSYSSPAEAAAAERRRRKRELRIQPPLTSLRHNSPAQRRPQTPIQKTPHQNQNPNAPKLPEHVSVLTGKRLDLHNKILTLIRENDLEEASLYTRHSIYSNCKPTVFTCNAVMAAFLRQSRYSELLQLHRFITQAGVAPNIVTYNLLINAYCDCRKTDTALEHYRVLLNDAPFSPSPTTYRILTKALVDNEKVERAVELKDDMLEKGLAPDAVVYNLLMFGLVKKGDADKAVEVYEELKEKLGFVSDGIVYGNLMKAYFQKGMEEKAMEIYEDVVGENSSVRMGAVAYNYVLQALVQNGKFDEGLKLFDRLMTEHSHPMKIMVNLGTFNVMCDGFCEQGRYKEAIEVFRKMGEKKCSPDTLSVNNLIEKLCAGGMLGDAEEIYREMGDGAKPDEITHILLIDTCFEQNRPEDAAGYFDKMVALGLKPNLNAYNKVVDGLIKAGKVVEANGYFSQMMEKLKLEAANYEAILRALCEASKLDEVLKLVGEMLTDEKIGLSSDMEEVVRDALGKEGREDDLVRLMEEKEKEKREKAEALAKKAEEERAAAAAKEAAKNATLSAETLSLIRGTKKEARTEDTPVNDNVASAATSSVNEDAANGNDTLVNDNVASAATSSVNEEVANGNQVKTEVAVSVDASPTIGDVEEAVVVEEVVASNGLDRESETRDDGVVEQVSV